LGGAWRAEEEVRPMSFFLRYFFVEGDLGGSGVEGRGSAGVERREAKRCWGVRTRDKRKGKS